MCEAAPADPGPWNPGNRGNTWYEVVVRPKGTKGGIMEKNYFITGINGFLGRTLAGMLLEAGGIWVWAI